jgi:two-component sensor histidine kinase/HAMP domain-containing protein
MMTFVANLAIRHKLMLIVMVSTIVALIVAGTVFVVTDRVSIQRAFIQKLEILTAVVGYNCTAAVTFSDKTDAEHILNGLRKEHSVLGAYLYDSTMTLFAGYCWDKQTRHDELIPAINQTIIQGELVAIARPISLDSNRIGTIVLHATAADVFARADRNILIMLLVTVASLLVSALIVGRLQRIVTDPVIHLASVAETVSSRGDYSQRAAAGGRDELGFLTRSFNDMLTQIQIRDAQLQKLTETLEERVHERTRQLELEVVERTRAEASLKVSLVEKEVLLKEIHHRVKNNLQIIDSLLNLQASKITDPQLGAVFSDSQGRVKSMALIHEMLYKSDGLSEINVREYVDSLCKFIMGSGSRSTGRITVVKQLDDVFLGVDVAVPCGLMINELMTNSLKYAFPGHRAGEISIVCRSVDGDMVRLTVADNGIGLPPHFDLKGTSTLGMQLVQSLILQLDGEAVFEGSNCVSVTITFPRVRRKSPTGEPQPVAYVNGAGQ